MSEKIDIQTVSTEMLELELERRRAASSEKERIEKNNKAWDELSDFAKLVAKEYFGFSRGEVDEMYFQSQKLDELKDNMFFISSYEYDSDEWLVYAMSERRTEEYIKKIWNNNKFQTSHIEKILGFKDGNLKSYTWKLDKISLVEMPKEP